MNEETTEVVGYAESPYGEENYGEKIMDVAEVGMIVGVTIFAGSIVLWLYGKKKAGEL